MKLTSKKVLEYISYRTDEEFAQCPEAIAAACNDMAEDFNSEFNEDLNRFKYLKRLLRRYEVDDDLQERLILNHLIVLYNVFGIEACNRMIWFKIEPIHWHYIKPFLVYLHYLPDNEKVNVIMDQ